MARSSSAEARICGVSFLMPHRRRTAAQVVDQLAPIGLVEELRHGEGRLAGFEPGLRRAGAAVVDHRLHVLEQLACAARDR